jgi:hypothetical protein
VSYLPALVAFAVAASVTWFELATSKYPRTLPLLRANTYLYVYAVIYGAFAAGVDIVYPLLFASPAPATPEITQGMAVLTANVWLRAALIGLTVKAFLHVRIFELTTGPGKSFPIGIETVTQIFEPWLLREIGLKHWLVLTQFMAPAVAKYTDVTATRARAVAAIPSSFDATEKAALISDLNVAAAVKDLLLVYLNNVGCDVFRDTFP